MSLLEVDLSREAHPVDVIEAVANANEWAFERAGDDEIAISVAGNWTDYHISFSWMEDFEALHLACAFDIKVSEPRVTEVMRLLALNMSTSPVVEASHDTGSMLAYYRKALVHTLRLIVPLALVVAVAAPYLLLVFGPDYAAGGATLLRLLALATIPSAFFSLSSGLLRAQNRIAPVVAALALTAVMTLGLSAWLLPIYGVDGVGIAWLISQTVAALFLFGGTLCKNYSTSAPTG